MIKNGKYFLPPPPTGEDFKELFARTAASGVGLPVDPGGFPAGQWTPERLAKAISEISANLDGVDLRTVQHWYEDNDKGISADNIRWLARIFGCDEPDDVRDWQIALSAANRVLAEKRKIARTSNEALPVAIVEEPVEVLVLTGGPKATGPGSRSLGLAFKTEAMFERQSHLGLPIVVFVAAVALGLIAFTLNIHSIAIEVEGELARQVGFLWAPNWTIVFLIVLPLNLAFGADLLKRWKFHGRRKLINSTGSLRPSGGWNQIIASTSYSYWAVLFITVVIASGYNWTASHLVPLASGDMLGWPLDWGRVAIIRPDIISVPSAIVFTGLVFLYNAACAYLFFSGLILLNVIVSDYSELAKTSGSTEKDFLNLQVIAQALRSGIFRCVSLGLMITILMKLQSAYLQSNSSSIITWTLHDMGIGQSTVLSFNEGNLAQRSAPGFFYSFFSVLAIVGTFIYSEVRIGKALSPLPHVWLNRSAARSTIMMRTSVALFVVSYFCVGFLQGAMFLVILSLVFFVMALGMSASDHKRSELEQ